MQERTPLVMVVGVDGGDGGIAALRWACKEAAAVGAVVEAVHAWSTTEPGRLIAREVWVALRDIDEPPEISHHAIRGSVSSVLVSRSAHAGLLVLGAGVPSQGRHTPGSVATTCRRDAACPVIIIDRNGRPLPGSQIDPGARPQPVHTGSLRELEQALSHVAADRYAPRRSHGDPGVRAAPSVGRSHSGH